MGTGCKPRGQTKALGGRCGRPMAGGEGDTGHLLPPGRGPEDHKGPTGPTQSERHAAPHPLSPGT